MINVHHCSPKQVQEVVDQLATAADVLRDIKEHYGSVCENFDLCKHPACMSSYSAWSMADEWLTENGLCDTTKS